MNAYDWLSLAIIAASLLFSAFLCIGETALSASSRARLASMEKQGRRGATFALRLLEARDRMTGAVLIGKIVANIAAISLAAGLFLACFGGVGIVYAIASMSIALVVFCEILPKAAAMKAPDRIAVVVARPMAMLVRICGPVLTAIEAIASWMLRPFKIQPATNPAMSSPHDEIRGQVDLLHREGSVEKVDRDMLDGLLDLNELVVFDVMIHRTDMVTVCADGPAEQVIETVLKAEFTRIPLWREKQENIVGILHVKDLLRGLRAAGGDASRVDVVALARPAWFVPDVRLLSEQLKAFRRRKTHFALVVDEYGEVQGLVTLEDILEEIVGDISDEHDEPLPGVQPQPDGSITADGTVPIRDLNRAMDWHLPDDEATTIAGLVIHEAQSIPESGQIFTFHGFRFRVMRKERNRIVALRITPLARKPMMVPVQITRQQ